MKKELKYFFYLLVIIGFVIFIGNYYFSDTNKKNFYRSFNNHDTKISIYSENLLVLNNNTDDIINYVDSTLTKDKKKYNFWKLLKRNEQ
tara:strand:- start:194 stop:460 length:267 start_codon:yes stop_codon:yes gene_type:complete